MDSFSGYHPLVNFLYFTAAIVFSMFLRHPILLFITLLCAFVYSGLLRRGRALRFNLLALLISVVLIGGLNPLFSHEGATVLFYMKNGNPFTLESIYFGVASALMFVAVIIWFSCYNAVMTSDKFIYLFGRVIPALSLIISMVLRLVPRYKTRIAQISEGQRAIGRDPTGGGARVRLKSGVRVLSIMTTWALESGVDTADSMTARGYGLPGRTAFSTYRFSLRDGVALGAILLLSGGIILALALGGAECRYFPTFSVDNFSVLSLVIFIAYLGLLLLPVICDAWEGLLWKRLESNI